MFIKSIVLDGFKSYRDRVEINGFHPEFNAITGLNGTGKSNILDSICFVLGITNLSNVRARSLQELIYKHGQAGIIKATVSITFDNRDKTQCPIGYENQDEITVTRQVVMGGKNKYLINGNKVQNKRVTDLFCSIQLNVNNPHFLIMQGRITKVLNMKPPEILSMIEEAAGTRMYEAKKQAALKTIQNKDIKLRELNEIRSEVIEPKLQRLRDERAQFQQYQKVVHELDNLSRLHLAFKYVSAEENAKVARSKATEVREDMKQKQEKIKNNEKESKDLDKQVADLHNQLDEESGRVLKELEAEVQALEREEARLAAKQRAAQDALQDHEKKSQLLQNTLAHDEAALHDKEKDFADCEREFSSLRAASEAGAAALAQAQQRFLAVSSGRDFDSDTLQNQLIAATKEASDASTRISVNKMKLEHVEERVRVLENEFTSSSAQYAKDQETIRQQQAEVDKLLEEVAGLEQGAEMVGTLQQRKRAVAAAARGVRVDCEARAARLQRAHFHYIDPQPGFDRRRVAGTVCKLIKVRDPVYCTALETAAGGRLYNVIVETAATSKLVVERGQLALRATFIPLDKIQPHVLPAETLRAAQEIGGGPEQVQLALELVQFDERVRAAMEYVFGSTLVCNSLETAKRVTFHPRVRTRCVTLDGDVFDPSGTLSGGANEQGKSVLLELRALAELEVQQQQVEAELAQCSAELDQAQRQADQYAKARQRYESLASSLEVVRTRVGGTVPAQLAAELDALRQQRAALEERLIADQQLLASAADSATQLQLNVNDIKGHREREFKKADEALKNAKKEAEQQTGSWKSREQELEILRLEASELSGTVQAARAQVAQLLAAVGALADASRVATEALVDKQATVKQMQSRIRQQKTEIASRSTDVEKLLHTKEQLTKENSDLELKIKELDYKIKEFLTKAIECEKRIKSLEKENPWIPEERAYFGQPGSLYDFAARQAAGQAAGAAQRLKELTERREHLSRGLNTRAHILLDKAEEQYQEVMRKKSIVEEDRGKLLEVMAELDEKKKKILAMACEQVNKDFGSIFSTLLPGAQAALRPPEGLTELDGLEVKVGFNDTWKESLGELSGGQRSLVALALVLAMLLFKPAPVYVLDEVDAALDLGHTQHIGYVIKNHFKHSQFIIVSLKDGMFNNANVLFRTRFEDGMSLVQRIVNDA